MLEIDNQRLYNETDQLKQPNRQIHSHEESFLREKLINSLQRSNVII